MPIVTENVFITSAPVPNLLQETGALISQGGTNLAPGVQGFLTQLSDLSSLLASPLSLSSLAWGGGSVTATTATDIPGLSAGDSFIATIAGASPSGYNGTYLATLTSSTTFTYTLLADPGTETVAGTYTAPGVAELTAMATSFFSQGQGQGVYVLELGPADGTTGPPLLSTWIAANPTVFYSYTVPRSWDGTQAYLALLAQFNADTAKTYFFTPTTSGTYSSYPASTKCIVPIVEAPNLPLTEYDAANIQQKALSYDPSVNNKMTPLGNAVMNGVTPYPRQGNVALIQALHTANVSTIGTGSEGGLPQTNILVPGKTFDGNDFSWWYEVDWCQIQGQQTLAFTVLTESQNPVNPLVYNQPGIDRLQDALFDLYTSALSFGILNGPIVRATLAPNDFTAALNAGTYAGQNVVNAVPFSAYTQLNPADYAQGRYAGYTAVLIPQRGFQKIVFTLFATNLLSQ